MNDELKQFYRETFDRIIFGVMTIGILAGLAAFFTQGVESPWFDRSVALVAVAVVAYIVRLVGLLVVASLILVLVSFGLTVDVLLQSSAPVSVTGYLFIPIIMIAGLLLHPIAGFLVAIGAGAAPFLVAYFTGQLTAEALYSLLPLSGVMLLVGLLVTQSKLNFTRLGDRLVKNRVLLKERALQLMQKMKQVDFLEDEVKTLTKQLKEIQTRASRQQSHISQENGHLYALLQGTIQELHDTAAELERSIESISALPDAEKHRDVLEKAWQRLDHLRAMAVNLEEMSQIDHSDFELDYDTVDIRQLIAEVAETARSLVRNKKITIHERVSADVSTLRADPDRLRQVLLHLLNNAIKYTDQGVIEIRAELDGAELVMFVSDTGIGVPSDEAETLFDRFSRGTSPTARARQGTGLGLAICKRLIELHKGRMWLTSVFGEGSTFYMALPLYAATQRTADRSRTTSKVTQRLQKLTPADLEAPEPVAADQTVVSVKRESERDSTIILPASHSIGKDADGETVIIPRSPVANNVPAAEKTAQAMLRGKDYRARQMEPIRRFQPTYIRRFGFVLLGVLFVVVTATGLLAVTNYPPAGETEAETELSAAAAADEAAIPVSDIEPDDLIPTVALDESPRLSVGQAAGNATGAATPLVEDQESALLLPTATPTAQSAQPTPTPTATATPAEVSVASTIEARNEPLPSQANPSPSPTATRLQLPTSTPVVVSISPTPAPSATPTPSPTAAVSTSAAIPAAVVQPSATPTLAVPTPPPSEVVFASGQTIFSRRDADNGAQVELPMLLDSNSRLSWSPSGQLLFSGEQESRRDIFVTNRDATSLVNLTQSAADDFQPDWAPAGDRIAFSSGRTGNFDIFAMAADGSAPVQLTTDRGFEEWPVWSPDGQKIAFVSDRDGNIELYTMDADGSNQQRLTNDPAEDWPAAWSPDGQWLAYASNRDADWNLYVVSAAGGAPQRLTDAAGNERDPIWSPDGSTIAFVYDGGGNYDVYTLPVPAGLSSVVPASSWTQVSDTPTDERFPTWGQAAQ